MLDQHLYVRQKLEEAERASTKSAADHLVSTPASHSPRPSTKLIVAPMARLIGSVMMSAGCALESWATSRPREKDGAT